MKKYIVLSFLLIPFLFGCLNLLGSEDSDEETEEKGSIQVTIQINSDSGKKEPSSYTVSIYNDKDELVIAKSGTPGGNVEVDDLLPGSYLVKVDGKDSDGTVIMSGSDSVSVTAGKSTSTTIQMEYLTGDIDITITLPSN